VPTLKEQIQELIKMKHRLAVWEAIYSLMDERFISKDGRKASAIRVPNCEVELVSEETIEAVLQAIGDGPIAEIQTQIDSIENQQIINIGEAKALA
jgi:hypothetical protein